MGNCFQENNLRKHEEFYTISAALTERTVLLADNTAYKYKHKPCLVYTPNILTERTVLLADSTAYKYKTQALPGIYT